MSKGRVFPGRSMSPGKPEAAQGI